VIRVLMTADAASIDLEDSSGTLIATGEICSVPEGEGTQFVIGE